MSNNLSHKEGKRQALLRDNFACIQCGSKLFLEYHHISYHVAGKETEPGNLKWTCILCSDCHQKIHDDINHRWNPKNPSKTPVL